jgi:dihydropteroate synthase
MSTASIAHVRSRRLMQGSTKVMGILNVTSDSFSDGGQLPDVRVAVEVARDMVASGADLLDVGGQSTRPGAARVEPEEEAQRVLPVIRCCSTFGPESRHAQR